MAKAGGTGGTGDAAQAGRVLDLRAKLEQMRAQKAREAEGAETPAEPSTEASKAAPAAERDAFGPQPTGAFPAPAYEPGSFDPGEERGSTVHSSVKARLQALGVRGSPLIKSHQTGGPRATETPQGRVLEGIIRAETAAGLAPLEGAVRAWEVALQEARVKSADLLILKTLREVGRLTLEGSPSLVSTDALSALEVAGSVYVGFNANLQRIAFLNLKRADVLIFEGNPNVLELLLPKLEVVTRYMHVHDHPNLQRAVIGSAAKPVQAAAFELQGNAHISYPDIFIL